MPATIAQPSPTAAETLAHRRGDRGPWTYVGVVAVEMFVVGRRRHTVLVNEMAPRLHNSGHWTSTPRHVSQFEQCVRAIAGLPLGATELRRGRGEMDQPARRDPGRSRPSRTWLKIPDASVHLYGKASIRPGRKMGHGFPVFRG